MVAVLIFLGALSWYISGGVWNTLAIAETTSDPPTSEQLKPGEQIANTRAASISASPINKKDFFSGNPIKDGGLRILYKGYRIGFCCEVSKQKWDSLSELQKNNFVQLSLSAK